MDLKADWVSPGQPALILAPMEGVTDAPMRALLTELPGLSFCVSEFLRVSQEVPPRRTFLEHVPELRDGCRTPSGAPIQIQLLGGDPELLAATALRAVELGARAIDLNFGCPAPTVNRHDGGATLLRYPDRIETIVRTVRLAVPQAVPVSAKLRLGWECMDDVRVNAVRAAQGGASWITIHGRTRMQGYKPPAYWGPIGEVRREIGIPVVANGEIWSLDDFRRCREETQCEHFMIGRGALGDPALAPAIARELGLPLDSSVSTDPFDSDPRRWIPLLRRFVELSGQGEGVGFMSGRIKQWLRYAAMRRELPWFETLKKASSVAEVFAALEAAG